MNVHVIPPTVHELDAKREHRPGAILFRLQGPADLAALRQLCEPGRTVPAVLRWENGNCFAVEVAPAGSPAATKPAADPKAEQLAREKARLMDLEQNEFKTLCGERGVKWSKELPRETLVEQVLAKAAAPAAS